MDPETWMAMQAYYMNGANSPALFPTGPAPDPSAPELDPYAQYLFSTGAMPKLNSKGEPVPYGLDYQQDIATQQKGMYGMVADPVNAYMASLLGGEAFAPGVFDPVNKETPITLSQLPMMQQMIAGGGYQGTLAKLMLPKELGGQGMNPATAVTVLQAAVKDPETATARGVDAALIEQAKQDLPQYIDTSFGGMPRVVEGEYDWGAIGKEAQGMWQPMAQEWQSVNAPGVVSRNGQFFSTEQIDSPQTEFLKKLGIPNPNARYDVQYLMENDPTIAGLFQHAAQTGTQADNMRKTFEQYTKKISKQREADAKTRAEDTKKFQEYQRKQSEYDTRTGPFGQLIKGAMQGYAQGGAPVNQWRTEGIPQGRGGAGNQWRTEDIPQGRSGVGNQLPPGATDVAFPGAPPTMPQLSPFSQGGQPGQGNLLDSLLAPLTRQIADAAGARDQPLRARSADEVSELFNRATGLLPKTLRPEQRAYEAARKPLQIAANRANKASSDDQLAMFKSMIPFMAMNAAGRTPAKDVIQQRMLPMYATGAYGQQGMPTAYPNRNAVMAAFGG